ncbi:MAG: OB-fold domain-containing protein [Pseudomonadota bacterium]|nr:OB-fold domain-containing protein [Pseudomonadota bacterium]
MTPQPIEDGYFVIKGEQPVLLGSYSPSTGNTYYPQRKLCPVTSEPVETVELPTEGELYSWTYVRMKMIGSTESTEGGGHGVGQIDLPCGTRVQSIIQGDMGDWTIGMKMRLALLPLKTDRDKNLSYCSYCFVPVND